LFPHLRLYLTHVLPGSFADCPDNILEQKDRLEDLFTVPTDQLKKITDHFVHELVQGLTAEGGDIVSFTLAIAF